MKDYFSNRERVEKMVNILKSSKNDIIVVMAIIMGIFIFLGITGNLDTAFHFTDDSEIIRFTNALQTESVVSVVAGILKSDFNMRFRPFYYLYRVFEAKIFGNNFLFWSIWNAVLACATFSFFYVGMRKLNYSIIESVIFIMFAFVGLQMAIWWRLGPSETIGTFFLGLTFYNTVLFCICLIITMLCKESFIIIAPAFIVFKLWYEKNKYELSIKETLRKNSLLVIPFLVMCFSLWLIIFVIGTNKIIYAGINTDIKIIPLVNGSYRILRNSFFEIEMIIILSLLLLYYELKDEKKFRAILIELILPAIFAFLIIVPNLILYAKSGMDERYLLPSTIGMAFLAVSILRTINKSYNWLFKLLVVIILIIFAKPTNQVVKRARIFANEGIQTEKMLAAIIQNSNEKSNVLLVANPALMSEWSNSLKTYLSLTNDINLYAFPVNDEYENDFNKFLAEAWHSRFEGRKFQDIEGDIDLVVFFNKKMDSLFYEESGMDPQNFDNLLEQDTDFGVYKRK